MRFGLALATDFPPGTDVRARIGPLLEQVAAAREAGFDSIWALQHYLGNLPTLQPLPLLARLAAETGRMRVGTNMFILPLRHPVDVAEDFATLHHLAEGGAIAGLGLGYRENEFAAFGVSLDDRVNRFTEAVAILRALWAGEAVTVAGEHYRLDRAAISLPAPEIPIWVGAGPHRTGAQRAAQLGDAWIVPPHVAPDELLRLLGHHASAGGSQVVLRREVLLHEDGDKARHLGVQARIGQSRAYAAFNVPDATASYRHLTQQADLEEGVRATADRSYLFGTPEECVAKLHQLEALGVSDVIVRMQWFDLPHEVVLSSLDLFARHVLPELAS